MSVPAWRWKQWLWVEAWFCHAQADSVIDLVYFNARHWWLRCSDCAACLSATLCYNCVLHVSESFWSDDLDVEFFLVLNPEETPERWGMNMRPAGKAPPCWRRCHDLWGQQISSAITGGWVKTYHYHGESTPLNIHQPAIVGYHPETRLLTAISGDSRCNGRLPPRWKRLGQGSTSRRWPWVPWLQCQSVHRVSSQEDSAGREPQGSKPTLAISSHSGLNHAFTSMLNIPASEASWRTWEFPWRASMRVKAWLFHKPGVAAKCHPHCEAMPFSPVQWSILRLRASSSHQKLWGCLVQWSSMQSDGNRWQSIFVEFSYFPSDSAHRHSLNNDSEMLRYWIKQQTKSNEAFLPALAFGLIPGVLKSWVNTRSG